jgi:hypothetical protein
VCTASGQEAKKDPNKKDFSPVPHLFAQTP